MSKNIESCWIISEEGPTIFSHTKKNGIDNQLFGGVLTAIISFAKELGTDIHKVDFDDTSLVTFKVEKLRVALMVQKPIEDREITKYHEDFKKLRIRHPDIFQKEHYEEIYGTQFAEEVTHLCQFIMPKKQAIEDKVRTVLEQYERGEVTKHQATDILIKLQENKLEEDRQIKTVQQLNELISNMGLNEEYKHTLHKLVQEYETRVKQAARNVKQSLFR